MESSQRSSCHSVERDLVENGLDGEEIMALSPRLRARGISTSTEGINSERSSPQRRSSWTIPEGYSNEFVPPLDPKHECKICMSALKEPYQTQCGHRFCYNCLRRWMSQRPTCPLDNTRLTEDSIYPDNFAKREILGLNVKCTNAQRGCDVVIELRKLEEHEEECPFRLISCHRGCGNFVMFKEIEKHEQFVCSHRLVECPKCDAQITCSDLANHQRVCPKMSTPCQFCNQVFPRDALDFHQRECPEVLAKCSYASLGCNYEGKMRLMEEHMKAAVNIHLELLSRYVLTHGIFDEIEQSLHSNYSSRPPSRSFPVSRETVREKTDDAWSSSDDGNLKSTAKPTVCSAGSDVARSFLSDYGSIKDTGCYQSYGAISGKVCDATMASFSAVEMNNRIKALEQKVVLQGQMITELQWKVLQQDSLKSEVIMLKSRLENLEEKLCDGTYLWRIENYTKLIDDAKRGKITVIHSRGFYTSVYGYKVCLRINLNNGGTYLSIFVHLMQGEYDEYLDWPFAGKISLCILDQNPTPEARKPLREVFVASPHLAAFQRPTTARNHKGFGYMEFIPLSVLNDGPYVKEDRLVIKAHIYEAVD